MGNATKYAESALLAEAAIAAFGALIANNGEKPIEELAEKAWAAGEAFVKAKRNRQSCRFNAILDKYSGAEALRRVLEADGWSGQGLEYGVSLYLGNLEPLQAYSNDKIGHKRAAGQIAINEFFKKAENQTATHTAPATGGA